MLLNDSLVSALCGCVASKLLAAAELLATAKVSKLWSRGELWSGCKWWSWCKWLLWGVEWMLLWSVEWMLLRSVKWVLLWWTVCWCWCERWGRCEWWCRRERWGRRKWRCRWKWWGRRYHAKQNEKRLTLEIYRNHYKLQSNSKSHCFYFFLFSKINFVCFFLRYLQNHEIHTANKCTAMPRINTTGLSKNQF